MSTFGITTRGFALKRLSDILSDMVVALSGVTDPATGESLTPDLLDENDPFIQQVQTTADAISLCWEQLQQSYNQFDPLLATGTALSGLVQLNGLERLAGETDAALRVRQQEGTTAAARGMIEDLYAAIKSLPGVTFCRVYQNLSNTFADSNGLPPRSLAAVVVGGSAIGVTTALFTHSPLCTFFGNVQLPYLDIQGVEYAVKFSRPTQIPIYVGVTCVVTNAALWPSDGETQVKNALVAYAAQGASAVGITTGYDQVGFVPGAPVFASELVIPVSSVPGIRILGITVGTSSASRGDNVSIAWNEQAQLLFDNIVVTA